MRTYLLLFLQRTKHKNYALCKGPKICKVSSLCNGRHFSQKMYIMLTGALRYSRAKNIHKFTRTIGRAANKRCHIPKTLIILQLQRPLNLSYNDKATQPFCKTDKYIVSECWFVTVQRTRIVFLSLI